MTETVASQPLSRLGQLSRQAIAVVAGSAILAISAHVIVPMWPVSVSLQTLAVFLIAAVLGARLGVAAVLLYLLEGAVGLPVFQGTPDRGLGLAYMAGPTAGYLVGFVVTAFIIGRAADIGGRHRLWTVAAAMLVSEIILLALGAAWLAVLFGWSGAFAYGIGPFIWADLQKLVLAAALAPMGAKLIGPLLGRRA